MPPHRVGISCWVQLLPCLFLRYVTSRCRAGAVRSSLEGDLGFVRQKSNQAAVKPATSKARF